MALARVMGITTAMGFGRVLDGAVVVVVRKVFEVVGLAMVDSGAMGDGDSGDAGLALPEIRAGGAVPINVTIGRLVRVVELWPAFDGVEDPTVLFPFVGAVVVKSISRDIVAVVVLAVIVVSVCASAGTPGARGWLVSPGAGTEIVVGNAG